MGFDNLFFLYILLPVLMMVYFLVPSIPRKNTVLIVFSLLFYSMGQPLYMIFLVGLSYLNYAMARKIVVDEPATVIVPVVLNILLLLLSKYMDMIPALLGMKLQEPLLTSFVGILAGGLNRIGFDLSVPYFVVPVGISFYTLSILSYLADVYNGRVTAERSFRNLLLYLMMFPKLLQGPIVRYDEMSHQLENRKHHPRAVFEGLQRFVLGLAKKVLLADCCAGYFYRVKLEEGYGTLVGVWFLAVLFAFFIYYELSGYTDMAIGLGKIFGFRYCENFDRPYIALSVGDFLRSWHMSLGKFFHDYIYLPLGGSRMGKRRQSLNMFIAMILTGLWYGGSWNLVLWAVYLFLVVTMEKACEGFLDSLPDWFCRCMTVWFILFGWIIFSLPDTEQLIAAFAAVLGYGGMGFEGLGRMILDALPMLTVCMLGCSYAPVYACRVLSGICGMGRRRHKPNQVTFLRIIYLLGALCVMVYLLWLCTVVLSGSHASYSIYELF